MATTKKKAAQRPATKNRPRPRTKTTIAKRASGSSDVKLRKSVPAKYLKKFPEREVAGVKLTPYFSYSYSNSGGRNLLQLRHEGSATYYKATLRAKLDDAQAEQLRQALKAGIVATFTKTSVRVTPVSASPQLDLLKDGVTAPTKPAGWSVYQSVWVQATPEQIEVLKDAQLQASTEQREKARQAAKERAKRESLKKSRDAQSGLALAQQVLRDAGWSGTLWKVEGGVQRRMDF